MRNEGKRVIEKLRRGGEARLTVWVEMGDCMITDAKMLR